MNESSSQTIRGIQLRLGPWRMLLGLEVLGKADNLTLDVAEATEAELKRLREADVITLVRTKKEG